jgi:plastocyanin
VDAELLVPPFANAPPIRAVSLTCRAVGAAHSSHPRFGGFMYTKGIALAAAVLALTTACTKDAATTVQTRSGDDGAGFVAAKVDGEDHNRKIAMRDACDPADPAWAPTGGCLLKRGDVTNAEFGAALRSPLAQAVVGHQSWRFEPSYASIESGKSLRISNSGGRVHTFTEVRQFGGGRVAPLNFGLTPAPECAAAVNVPAGGSAEIPNLSDGVHNFECCIHPWMRATVKVSSERGST